MKQYFDKGIDTSGINKQRQVMIDRHNGDDSGGYDFLGNIRSAAGSLGSNSAAKYATMLLGAAVLFAGYAMVDHASAEGAQNHAQKIILGGGHYNSGPVDVTKTQFAQDMKAGKLRVILNGNHYNSGPVDVTKTQFAQDMKAGRLKIKSADGNTAFGKERPSGKSKFGRDPHFGDEYGSPKAARQAYGIESKFDSDPFFTVDGPTPQATRYLREHGEQVRPDTTTVDGYIERSRMDEYDPLTDRISPAWVESVDSHIENSRLGEPK